MKIDGMRDSDRCMFCGSFYEKEKPFICPHCWALVKEIATEYRDEIFVETKKLGQIVEL